MSSAVAGAQTDDLNGSMVEFNLSTFNSPTDVDLIFTATMVTTSTEWFDQVTIRLPAPWTIVSLNGIDFDTTSGVGSSVARFTDSGYPCSEWGKSCASGCILSIKINPNGNMDPGVPATWMLEGDGYNSTPDSVICSASDPCNDADACYASLGIDQTGLDLHLGPVPVEIMTFSIE